MTSSTAEGRGPRAAPDLAAVRLPRRLRAPAPGWRRRADVVVVGSGIAGLTAALRLSLAPDVASVVVVTKDLLAAGSTRWAQGGIAAALGPGDTPYEHGRDTLVAGQGLCDREAVRVLVEEGPDAVRELIDLGALFDAEAGVLSLTREGGHHRDRIAHAGGDATGAEIQRALVAAVREHPSIEVVEHAFVLDLLRDADGAAAGVTVHVMGEGERDGVGAVEAPYVVLASGGLGQVFAATTNPAVATGDGVALALRAGAVVRDLEFVQFHPTVLWTGADARGQQPLISEAVRGEGAVLRDHDGERFLRGVHELEDLAPRDVVAKAIMRRMLETKQPHVWLDGRHLSAERWERRFPTVLASCRAHGVDPVTELVPVGPACHYASGGVVTDLHGRTSVERLYACGEVACSGVHGANRLASNSLLEGLVLARRIAVDVGRGPAAGAVTPVEPVGPDGVVPADVVGPVQELMSSAVGVLRDDASTRSAAARLAVLADLRGRPGVEDWQATNLLTVAAAVTVAAHVRTETRGSHWRDDHRERDDARWAGHLDATLDEVSGALRVAWVPTVPTDRPADLVQDAR